MSDLKFKRTQTIEQFKAEKKISEIRVLRSPKTGKLFLSWVGQDRDLEKGFVGGGTLTGLSRPVISLVEDPETKSSFYLLHNEGEGLETEATF